MAILMMNIDLLETQLDPQVPALETSQTRVAHRRSPMRPLNR